MFRKRGGATEKQNIVQKRSSLEDGSAEKDEVPAMISETQVEQFEKTKRNNKKKKRAPMLGDPDYEKLMTESFGKTDSTSSVNPVKWLSTRKEKKQQQMCRMEWQDFEIDRLKCENEILVIREIKNEREKEELQQEIFDYKNCLAIAYIRMKSLFGELKETHESLKQVHEWLPEGEEETSIQIQELNEHDEDKAQLANLVSDLAALVDKIRTYTEQLYHRSATKYFAAKGASRSTLRRDSVESSKRRSSTPPEPEPDANRRTSAGFWLAEFHNACTEKLLESKSSKPWWKKGSILESDKKITSPVDSETDLKSTNPPGAKKSEVSAKKTPSKTVDNQGHARNLSAAIAMLEFAHDEGVPVSTRGSASHSILSSDSQGYYRQQQQEQQGRKHTAQELVHGMFGSIPKLAYSDDDSTTTGSHVDVVPEIDKAKFKGKDHATMEHRRRASLDAKKLDTKDTAEPKPKTSSCSQSQTCTSLNKGSTTVSHQASSAIAVNQPRETSTEPIPVQHMETNTAHDIAPRPTCAGSVPAPVGTVSDVLQRNACSLKSSGSYDPALVGTDSGDLFRLLQQTEHEVHMLRDEREDLIKQLNVAQDLLNMLSREIEEQKKEISMLKDKSRKVKQLLG